MLENDYLEGYRDPQAYDAEDAGYVADIPLTEQLAQSHGGPILDIACGTGTMAIYLAKQGYAVTGLDIIPEMTNWAAQKAIAQNVSVEWVLADARAFHLGKQFTFITLLGNAFQHFLTRQDQEGLLACVREHLQAEGCFLFVTRNPTPKNLAQARFTEPHEYTMPDGRRLVATETQHYDAITQIQHYTFHNQWFHPDGQHVEKTDYTALRYVFPQEMEALLYYNGFQIRACYGDWQQTPLTADSRSMIYVCQKSG
ncbi:MAG: class I SAM-dependent methyltransferase [Chloroflexota bacterium]